MAAKWLTITDAASELGVSTRTIERRAKAGDLETRLSDQGRREVLIDPTPTRADMVADSLSVVQETSDRQLQIASTAVQLAQQQTEDHRRELRRSRWVGFTGWAAVGVLVIAGAFGLWTIAGQRGQIDLERGRAEDLRDTVTVERARADTLSDRLRQAELDLQATRSTEARTWWDKTFGPTPDAWPTD